MTQEELVSQWLKLRDETQRKDGEITALSDKLTKTSMSRKEGSVRSGSEPETTGSNTPALRTGDEEPRRVVSARGRLSAAGFVRPSPLRQSFSSRWSDESEDDEDDSDVSDMSNVAI